MHRKKYKARAIRRSGKYLAVTLVGLALATPLVASAQNWYLGAGVGQSKADDIATLPGGSTDDTDTGWKVFGGYMYNPNVGLELSYLDFGKFSGSAPGQSVEAKPTGIDLSVLGVWPLPNQFAVFAKIGANHWNVDTDASGLVSGSQSDNGTDLSYGIGAQYNFTKNVGGRLAWQRFQDVGNEGTTGQSDIDLWSVSVVYNFP